MNDCLELIKTMIQYYFSCIIYIILRKVGFDKIQDSYKAHYLDITNIEECLM